MDGYREIGKRLCEYRETAGLSAEQAARAAGVSRALLYRYEAGNIVKLDVLDKLARVYGTSPTALLGLGNEYVTHGLQFFERVQKLEAAAEQLTVVFGPIAYLLTSERYDTLLAEALTRESEIGDHLTPAECQRLMHTLAARKAAFRYRSPTLVSIVPLAEVKHYLETGMGGLPGMAYARRAQLRREALREIRHMAELIVSPPMGVQIALTPHRLPTAGFELMRAGGRRLLVNSPFRIAEPTNLRYGVATVTEDPAALRMYAQLADRLWEKALKAGAAADELHRLIQAHDG
ncbi:helix-turn-helix transcriptional regulator [Verticiella sediminum]|uniref:Helix-turn-helix transcriptional regulator n=1 Tax=Verticiella sediminum TaxID=1247510 RepID=A0A556A7S4_9BURK|nr:helix-turn-helix domain-containing protein [Verticiella sediminum]TSH88939.1 helix-turn-helix transcriptional regulator [Verticiella sediminum]